MGVPRSLNQGSNELDSQIGGFLFLMWRARSRVTKVPRTMAQVFAQVGRAALERRSPRAKELRYARAVVIARDIRNGDWGSAMRALSVASPAGVESEELHSCGMNRPVPVSLKMMEKDPKNRR